MSRFRFTVLTTVPMILIFLGVAALVQTNWYEYHVIAAGEEPSGERKRDA